MKPRTVRDLLISLGLTAGLGAGTPACDGTLMPTMTTNPPPVDTRVGNPLPDSGIPIDASNPPLPDAAPWPDAVTNPPPLEGGLRPDADTGDTSDAAEVGDGATDGDEGDAHEIG